MHLKHRHVHPDLVARDYTTINGQVMSIVYETASPTFTGVIGGFSTVEPSINTPFPQATSSQQLNSPTASPQSSPAPRHSTSPTQASSSAAITSAAAITSSAVTSSFTADSTPIESSYGSNTAVAGASTTSSSSSASSSSSSGISTGAKVGIVLAVIAIIGVVAAAILVTLAKKRKAQEARIRAENEKSDYDNRAAAAAAAAAARNTPSTSAKAPRLSLRPMSKLVPDMMGNPRARDSNNQGNMLSTFDAPATRNLTPSPMGTLPNGPPRENPFQDPINPFADPEKVAAAGAVPTAAAMAAGAARGMERGPVQQPLNGSPHMNYPMGPGPGPNGAAPSPTVAQGPGPDLPAGNVYRILMDFKPTLEDELGLTAGQLVRMLHEYDDGWALCIRLDRSQQGVVPRTCLAAKPSKPRPTPGPQPFRPGPPGTPNGRMSPAMSRPGTAPGSPALSNRSRPASPASRGMGPVQHSPQMASEPVATGAFNQPPRPLSPGPRPQPQKRSMSPGPYGGANGPAPMAGPSRRRSQSATNALDLRAHGIPAQDPSNMGSHPVTAPVPGVAL